MTRPTATPGSLSRCLCDWQALAPYAGARGKFRANVSGHLIGELVFAAWVKSEIDCKARQGR